MKKPILYRRATNKRRPTRKISTIERKKEAGKRKTQGGTKKNAERDSESETRVQRPTKPARQESHDP